jgi:hypothetical protein
MQKLEYLLQMKKPFKLFCDHKNLIQIFSPSQVTKPTAQKLQRWALEMQRFRYEIEHIKGEENLWADLMTRWGAKPSPEEPILTVRRTKRMQILMTQGFGRYIGLNLYGQQLRKLRRFKKTY